MKERHLRSIIKGITWRVVATVDTIALSYLVTESVTMAFKIASIELFTKTVLYYFHERIQKGMFKFFQFIKEDQETIPTL